MSESTSAPATAPTGDTTSDYSAPAPDTQPAVSVSDAARLLRAARRQMASSPNQSAGSPNAPTAPATAPATAPTAPDPAPADAGRPRGVAAMEAALGLAPATDSGDAAQATQTTQPMADGIELGGRRWTQAELQAELSKAQDYTHKTQQVAAQARELEAQQRALAQFLPYIQPEVEALQRRLAESPRPDPMLRQTDPATYWDQFAAWQDAMHEQQRVHQVMATQQQAREAAQQQAVEQANQELAARYPFWNDPTQRREIQLKVIEWARAQGYPDAELQSLTSARHLETLFKAALYDDSVKGARTAAPKPSVAAAPPRGAAPPVAPAARVTAAMEAFDAKPDWRTGAALIGARRAGTRTNGHSNW